MPSSSSSSASGSGSSAVSAIIAAVVAEVACSLETPRVEFCKDKRAWFSDRFPHDLVEAGRGREVSNLISLEAVEDAPHQRA